MRCRWPTRAVSSVQVKLALEAVQPRASRFRGFRWTLTKRSGRMTQRPTRDAIPHRRARTVNRRALFQVIDYSDDLTGLVRPHLVEMTKREDNPNAAEFRLQPLERGYGYTLGNSLRRHAAVLAARRRRVGVPAWTASCTSTRRFRACVEDVHQIIQRLKQLTLVLAPEVDEAVLRIKREKAGPVYARDIEAARAVSDR